MHMRPVLWRPFAPIDRWDPASPARCTPQAPRFFGGFTLVMEIVFAAQIALAIWGSASLGSGGRDRLANTKARANSISTIRPSSGIPNTLNDASGPARSRSMIVQSASEIRPSNTTERSVAKPATLSTRRRAQSRETRAIVLPMPISNATPDAFVFTSSPGPPMAMLGVSGRVISGSFPLERFANSRNSKTANALQIARMSRLEFPVLRYVRSCIAKRSSWHTRPAMPR